jgi:hypothetical protein
MHSVEYDLEACCLAIKLSVHVFDLIELAIVFVIGGGCIRPGFASIVARVRKCSSSDEVRRV